MQERAGGACGPYRLAHGFESHCGYPPFARPRLAAHSYKPQAALVSGNTISVDAQADARDGRKAPYCRSRPSVKSTAGQAGDQRRPLEPLVSR